MPGTRHYEIHWGILHCLKRDNKSLQPTEGVKLSPYTISRLTLRVFTR